MSVQIKEGEAEDPFDPGGPDEHWYHNDLHRFLVSRLPNRDDVRELAQEAYLRYIQSTKARAIRRPRDYIFRVARNLISEWQLLRGRSPVTCNSKLAEQQSTFWADSTGDACEQLITQERLERVLEQIPLACRRVLILHRCDDLSIEQIADQLDLSPQTVRRYLVRATAYARRAQWE